ncbi:MAG: sensor histidine kinase, partial [Nocardioidaceae bacterium]
DMHYGVITIDTVEESFLEWVWLPIAFGLWWSLVPVLMRWRAQIDRALLEPVRPAPVADEAPRTTTTDPGAPAMSSSTSYVADPLPRRPIRSRFGLTGLAVAYMLLALPTLVVLALVTAAVPLSVVVVGLFVLSLVVPLNRQLANVHRWLAGLVLGTRIDEPYLPGQANGPVGQVRNWSRDPARWRDAGWMYVSVTIGFVLCALAVGLLLGVVWFLIFPFIFWVSPDGVFDINYGLFTIDTVRESFYEWIWAFVCLLLWWRFAPVLLRARARLDRSLLAQSRGSLERRVAQVAESRAETIDHSAAELRRIERDLHDGAQARLVSLGMSLGMAEQLIATDPAAAARLLEEARLTTTTALGDLRSVVRGIHPPVLSDRGLAGAVQALALDMAIPVAVTVSLPGRPPAPVESAAYFAVAECLANTGKHAGASRGAVELSYDRGRLWIRVEDDGRGGADVAAGTGLAGVSRRLDAFDGTIEVVSPTGGPTTVTMELPCVLSSPKTSPSSGTD